MIKRVLISHECVYYLVSKDNKYFDLGEKLTLPSIPSGYEGAFEKCGEGYTPKDDYRIYTFNVLSVPVKEKNYEYY